MHELVGSSRVEEMALMLGATGEAAYRSAEEILEMVTGYKERR